MRFLLYIILLLSLPMFVFGNEDDLPHKDFKIKQTYKLDNGNTILIEHTGMNNAIWEKDFITGKFNKISIVWNFIALAKSCEGIDEKDIYFAQNKEYYLMGGIDENPTIRIFNLHNKKPWRDSDLDIVPNMEWANEWCIFYN